MKQTNRKFILKKGSFTPLASFFFSFPHNPALEKTLDEAAASLLNSRSTLYAPVPVKQLLSDFARTKRLMEIPLTIVNLD